MSKARDVGVFIAVAAAFAVSLEMFRRLFGVASPWFGMMIMADFLGLVAFGRPLFRLRLPGLVRKPREWETSGAAYKALRVPAFGELLRRTPLRFLNPLVYLRGPSDDASVVIAQLESAEAAHFVAAALLVPYIIHAWMQGRWSTVAWFMAFQVIFNLYPILNLRWARIRLGRVHQRMLSRTVSSAGNAYAHLG